MTSTGGDPIALLSRALDQTGAIIARVRPEQATMPTPCPAWDVRALVNHVVQDLRQFTAAASGQEWDQDDSDVVGDDWDGAFQEAADSLLAGWRREGALDRTVKLPFGEVPATWQVDQQITDMAVHGWDVARATGQPTDLDPELGQLALDWGSENLKPQFRGDEATGHAFGIEVPVDDDAPLYDRLAGFFGRDPT